MMTSVDTFTQNVGISSSGATPDASAALDINFTNKGTLITRLTSSQRNAVPSPATGLLIYNTDCNVFNFYNGTTWVLMDGSTATLGTPGSITGNSSVCTSATGESYSISAVSGATGYTWTVPSGANITAGQGTTSITVDFGSTSGNVTVVATSSCETSSASVLAVSVANTPATPGAISGPTSNCPNDVAVHSISAVPDATSYTWTVDSDISINSGQGTTSINVTYNTKCWSGTNISVTASNGCGTSAAQSLGVTYPSTSVYSNFNGNSVNNGSTSPTINIGSTIVVAEIATYHWNGSAGSPPGTIALYNTGTTVTYGPWAANPLCSGNDIYWIAYPTATIPAGTYQVVDSDAATWSKNATSGNKGFVYINTCP